MLNSLQIRRTTLGLEHHQDRGLLVWPLLVTLALLLLAPGAALADLDGDGFPDAIFANDGQRNRLCLGDGAGGITGCSDISTDTFATFKGVLGDVDGDGDLDAMFANQGASNRVCTNDGSGGFTCANVSGDTFSTVGVALGDVDGDSDLDAIFANQAVPDRVCTNDGSGAFTCANVSADTFNSVDTVLGDVDGDGDLDAVFASFSSQTNRVCTNDGSGSFTCANVSGDTFDTFGVALGDMDGDGDLDALFANWVQTNRICTNDGSGSFTCANVNGDTLNTRDVALGDMDGDGDLDAIFTQDPQVNQLCTNDGGGNLSCANVSADTFSTFGVALGDMDDDGDLDAAFANANSQANQLCPNDGGGGLSCAGFDPSAETRAVALSAGTPAPTPELSIATSIPAAESETVDADVSFTSGGTSTVATAFSVDYDETCLSFDDTDVSPIDGIPDDLAVLVPGDFDVTVFHDLGDSDGEIDILISDLSPPLATLGDGPLVTLTFTATCSPALGATIVTPLGFSSDPVATFSDDLAQDVAGTTADGSVEIYPGPRGDCNGSGSVSVADIVADSLEIFDGDGTFWVDVVGDSFLGSPVGCDANADTAVNAGDVSCTTLLIFGGSCSGGGESLAQGEPRLVIDGSTALDRGASLWVPVYLKSQGQGLSSLAFSLDLGSQYLRFDPSDKDRDGLPDAVRFPAGTPSLASVRFDERDADGELDILLSDLSGAALADGVVLELRVEALRRLQVAQGLRFSTAPEASFGSVAGESVPGQAIVEKRAR